MATGVIARFRPAAAGHSASLFLSVAINAFGAGMFFPFALIYYQAVTDLTVSAIGFAITIATALTLAFNPVAGMLVDRFGARRIVALSQGIQAVGFIGYLFVSSSASLVAAALIATAGSRIFFAAFSTLIAESVTGADRDRWYGLVGVVETCGGSLSGVLASLLIGSLGVIGFRAIIVVNACCLAISSLLIASHRQSAHAAIAREDAAGFRQVYADRVFIGIVASNLLFVLCSMLIGIGFAIYATEALHAPLWIVGVSGFLQTGLVIGLQGRVTSRLRGVRRTRCMIAGGGIWIAGYVLFGAAVWIPRTLIVPWVIVAAIAFTIAQILYIPASRALAAELAPEAGRGRAIATFELSYGVAAAIGPALFGFTFDIGQPLPWFLMSAIVIVAMFTIRRLESGIPLQRNRPGTGVIVSG